MSSRRERRKKLFQQPQSISQARNSVRVPEVSRGSAGARTISPRALKIIIIAIIILIVLFFLSPKPPTPPGPSVKGANSTLQPIELNNNIQTTLPSTNASQGGDLGNTLNAKLKIK